MNYKNIFSIPKVRLALEIESRALGKILRHGYPDYNLHFLGGLGDEVMLTCLARELKIRNPSAKIWQISAAAELLMGNPDYSVVLNTDWWNLRHSNLLKKTRTKLGYSEQLPGADVWGVPKEHVLIDSLRKVGVRGQASLRPYIYLSDEEISEFKFAEIQICFQSVGVGTHETWMKNKLWSHSSWDQVVKNIGASYPFVKTIQLGSKSDLPLPCDIDLRGKTSLRSSAAVLAASSLFVGTEGFLPHLARAVNTRSVVIFGGRSRASQLGYIANINLESFPECSPCWAMSRCDHAQRCMTSISVEDVCVAIAKGLDEYGIDLPIEVVTID
jgi:ADP-heptose:LPS heptosyltransferase